ncbi:D-tyrosyl-tRNA(Tyr) deacylase [Rhodopirellula sp. JC740]|uniref:D-aminoacyl-tRNA deacylase n=1 Tax=Rhodopirellula halodulae TaxID=2894198 RepID=A0ABS8NKI9_9BACT|nr:D-aminoacyl-tRNA deacylase [Rhodopirellula sp. JC740]MCC9644055.1 D-tyrosyl-tRNA(Tyr) deacylase [Rhodopirellula sp. JC740]
MKIVLQRTQHASVSVDGQVVGEIDRGLVALIGIGHNDTEATAAALADKTAGLRIFSDENGKMNRNVLDAGGEVLAISQFTLLADCRKGRRPAFTDAAPPDQAKHLYEHYMSELRKTGLTVPSGIFAADMAVSLVNDGPVTIILEL